MITNNVVFLFDVDNTLLDNDRVTADLRRYLECEVGAERQQRYFAIFEQLRAELGYADYLGVPIVEAIRRATSLPLETHLMIQQPERYIETFVRAGADYVIVHQETSPHLNRTVQSIKRLGKKAGVALNPSTPAVMLEEILEDMDLVLIMTVNPGFGGQHFIDHMLKKIRQVRLQLDARNRACELEVDGGIDIETVPMVVEAGTRVLVAGASIFARPGEPEAGIESLFRAVC